jgi:signal transduction histidine kinase
MALAPSVAEALLGDDRVDEALAVIETALDHVPPSPARGRIRLIQARAKAKLELWSQALDAIHSAAMDLPDDEEVIATTAEVHYRAQLYGPALTAARSLCSGRPPVDDVALSRWLHHRALWAQSALEVEGAEAAIAILNGVPDHAGDGLKERSLLEGVRGRILWHAGQVRQASAAFDRAAGAEGQLGTRERARMRNNGGLAWYRAGDLNRAIASWEQALLLFERLGDELDQIRVLVNLCQGLREAGRWERGRQAGSAAVTLSCARGVREFELVALGNLGDLAVATGDLDEAEAYYARAAMLAEVVQDQASLAEIARRRAEVAAVGGRSDALSLARTAAASAVAAEVPFEVGRAQVLEALALVRAHEEVDLDERLATRTRDLRADGAAGELAWVRRWMAEAMLEAGRIKDAVALAEQVVAWAVEIGHVQLRRDAESVVARARARGRRSEVAPLQQLVQHAAELVRIRDSEELLPRIAAAALDVLDVDRAFVLVLDDDGEPIVRARATADSAVQSGPSLSVVRRALTRRREVLAADLEERADLRDASSVLELDLRAALCVPLLDGPRVLGAIYVDSGYAVADALGDATANLRVLAALAAAALADAQARREREEAIRRTAEVAHDVRGPLTGLALTAEMILAEGAAEPWVLEELPSMVASLRRAGALLDRLLDSSAACDRGPVDLGALLDDLVVQLGPQARAAGVSLSRGGVHGLRVVGDYLDLARAASNLVSNALRFAPPGSTVDVDLTSAGGAARVVVRDRGPGLPAQPERLLERGVTGDEHSGHGLGLAIAARVAREHGGTLELGDHPDGGAVFTLVLPRAPAS